TSNPSSSASGRSARRAEASASSLFTRNSCSVSVIFNRASAPGSGSVAPGAPRRSLAGAPCAPSLCDWISAAASLLNLAPSPNGLRRRQVAFSPASGHARLFDAQGQLVDFAVEHGRLKTEQVLTVQLL